MSSTTIWVKITGAGADSVTFVDCDVNTTHIARLKELVKAKYPQRFEQIDAPYLAIKGTDGATIDEDIYLSATTEGRIKAEAFVVEIPATVG